MACTGCTDLISRSALKKLHDEECCGECGCCIYVNHDDTTCTLIEKAPAVDAIPIDAVAEMLADLFGEECCCNYNGIDEWLPELCEHSDTCPEAIGKNGCWKQFIKHWKERKKEDV